jgi:hypothetical protein
MEDFLEQALADMAEGRKKESKPKEELGQVVVDQVRELASKGQRLTYGKLGELHREESGTETGLSNGQMGSSLVKQLPEELQPFVCQTSGRYHKKAKEALNWEGAVRSVFGQPILDRVNEVGNAEGFFRAMKVVKPQHPQPVIEEDGSEE